MLNSLKQALFNKYSDILQLLQICQVGEYPYVDIHNVVGTKIPVKKLKRKIQDVTKNPIFALIVSKNGRKKRCFGCITLLQCKKKPSHNSVA